MTPVLEFGVNLLVAALLVATILYCWRLNRRIRVLQDGRGELAALLKQFDESTRRASESIQALQTASRKIGEVMQSRIDQANRAADDLTFLTERAMKISERMSEGAMQPAATKPAPTRAAPVERPVAAAPPAQEAAPISSSLAALRDEIVAAAWEEDVPPQKRGGGVVKEAAEQANSRSLSSLQAMLEKLSSRAGAESPPAPVRAAVSRRTPPMEAQGTASQENRARSRVEQELLDLIRAGNNV